MARSRTSQPGSIVRALREHLGVTQVDLAIRLRSAGASVDPLTVSRWERGQISELTWRGVLATLGLPLEWRPADDPPPDPRDQGEAGKL